MKFNFKAALLSALILPGMGQIVSGRKIAGIVMIVVVNLFILAALALVLQGAAGLFVSAKTSGDISAALTRFHSQSAWGRWLFFCFGAFWAYCVGDALLDRKDPESH